MMERTEVKIEKINEEMRIERKAKKIKAESDMVLEQAYFQLLKRKVENL